MDWTQTGTIIAAICTAAGGLWVTIRGTKREDDKAATIILNAHIDRLTTENAGLKAEMAAIRKEFADFKDGFQTLLVEKTRLEERNKVLERHKKSLIKQLREIHGKLPVEESVDGENPSV